MSQAEEILQTHKIEKLPVVDEKGILRYKREVILFDNKEDLKAFNKLDSLKEEGGSIGNGTIIATGSEPSQLKGIQVDEKTIVSSTGALSLTKIPKKLIIVGAGVIGLELGSVYSRLGTDVTVLEYLEEITPGLDKETSKMFRWFNCLAYSTLAALIARIVIFPSGSLSEIDYLIRFVVVILSVGVFYLTKKNLVYPTLFSAIILSVFSSYL